MKLHSWAIDRDLVSEHGAAKAQTMNEDTFMNGENSNYGAMFANKITVDCP